MKLYPIYSSQHDIYRSIHWRDINCLMCSKFNLHKDVRAPEAQLCAMGLAMTANVLPEDLMHEVGFNANTDEHFITPCLKRLPLTSRIAKLIRKLRLKVTRI